MTPSQVVLEALMGESAEVPLDLSELLERPAWMRDALCRESPQVEFHPRRGESTEPAKAVCRRCLCRRECLDYAVDTGEEHGIWGGLAPRARQALRRDQDAA